APRPADQRPDRRRRGVVNLPDPLTPAGPCARQGFFHAPAARCPPGPAGPAPPPCPKGRKARGLFARSAPRACPVPPCSTRRRARGRSRRTSPFQTPPVLRPRLRPVRDSGLDWPQRDGPTSCPLQRTSQRYVLPQTAMVAPFAPAV